MPTYSKEQIRIALELYKEERSATQVVRKLGYPTKATVYLWLSQKKLKPINRREHLDSFSYQKRRTISPDLKIEIIKRCFENGEDVRYVAEEMGVSRQSIHNWRRIVETKGLVGLMNKDKKKIVRANLTKEKKDKIPQNHEIKILKNEVKSLKMEVDILKEALDLIKKDKGIDFLRLKNREKVQLINALKEVYPLKDLLKRLNLPKSSYHYHFKKPKHPAKYVQTSLKIKEIYENNRCVYGYRRIKMCLNKQGVIISEKVIRRLMKEMELMPQYKSKPRKYSSYQGEISEAPQNIINRDFSAELPNQKWLTDITEFALSNEKVYLSSIIDCFDGKIIAWKSSTSPNAQLANESLIEACKVLNKSDQVILHSDRGGHYRWNEWIKLTKDNNIIRSMSKKGCTGDNAACEGVFGHIKNECFYGKDFRTFDSSRFIDYLDNYLIWFNEDRIKIRLGCSINENRRRYGY